MCTRDGVDRSNADENNDCEFGMVASSLRSVRGGTPPVVQWRDICNRAGRGSRSLLARARGRRVFDVWR